MPVTVSVVDHPARPWGQDKANSVEAILEETNNKEFTRCKQVIQSVFSVAGSIQDNSVGGSTGKKNFGFPGIQPVSGRMIYGDKDGLSVKKTIHNMLGF